jgi:hypothetical protein
MQRSSPRRSTILLGGALAALALLGAGCSAGPGGDALLVAEATPSSNDGVRIWAAEPGDELTDDNLAIATAQRPNAISTRTEDGASWVNGLGRAWAGKDLISYGAASGNLLVSVEPGDDPHELASSAGLSTTVLRRGAFVRTAEGCSLATSATESESIGEGSCVISTDERWVASWPNTADAEGPSLTVRDLRNDHDEEIELDEPVRDAVVLAAQARVFAVVQTDDGVQGVVFDATNGDEIARTETAPDMVVATPEPDAEGFVVLTSDGAESTLSWVDTEGDVTEIESGANYLVPVAASDEVVYLSYAEELGESSVREWAPGDDEPHVLLEGQVGAGTADGHLVVLREVPAQGDDGATVEFWRPGYSHDLEKVLTIDAPEGTLPIQETGVGATVPVAWVRGHTLYLQLDLAEASSFVRIDLTGDDSEAPIENEPRLLLESLDADGTALLTLGDAETDEDRVVVVGPHSHDPVERGTFAGTGLNLIHEGVIYVTDTGAADGGGQVSVRSIRATGDPRPELLWKDRQLAGATWPEQNGATVTSVVTVGSLLAAQQQQQQTGAGAGATGGAGTAPGA